MYVLLIDSGDKFEVSFARRNIFKQLQNMFVLLKNALIRIGRSLIFTCSALQFS